MEQKDEILIELVGLFGEESSEEIKTTIREEYLIGRLDTQEPVWRFSFAGQNYIIFCDREQARRIAIQTVERRLINREQSFEEGLLSKHIRLTNPSGFAHRKAREKYDYMDTEALIRDYRSGLSHKKENLSEQKIYEARQNAISSYVSEILHDLIHNPMNYFEKEEGIYSVYSILNQYSECELNVHSAAESIIEKESWGSYLSLIEDQPLYTSQNKLIVREYE